MSEVKDLEKIKIPYVMKNKVLMSPGIWNNYFYSNSEIEKAFSNTDWDSKENRSLFLDHKDGTDNKDSGALTWVGEVVNQHMDGDTLVGDLIIVDKPTAMKLAYGAKMGISPKVTGEDGGDAVMRNFRYDNFSVVINPAVKTAYINMSQNVEEEMAGFEEIRKARGIGVNDFYAVPRKPPSASKLPIFDAAHVRNAMARFNQVIGLTDAERATAKNKILEAAKKFGIDVSNFKKLMEVNKMADEEIKEDTPVEGEVEEVDATEETEETKESEESESKDEEIEEESEAEEGSEETKDDESETKEAENSEVSAYTEFVKTTKLKHSDWGFDKITQEWNKIKSKENAENFYNSMSSVELLDQILKLTDILRSKKEGFSSEFQEKPVEKPVEKPKPKVDKKKPVEKPKDEKMSAEMSALTEKLSKIESKLNEPDKQSKKSSEVTDSLSKNSSDNVDKDFLDMLRDL